MHRWLASRVEPKSVLFWSGVLLVLASGPVDAQSATAVRVLGSPVNVPPEPEVGAAETRSTFNGPGLGSSGALRVLVVEGDNGLDLGTLSQIGDGWELGHRWVPLAPVQPSAPEAGRASPTGNTTAADRAGPRVLGDPVLPPVIPAERTPADLQLTASVLAPPTGAAAWRLESSGGVGINVLRPTLASNVRGGYLNGYHIGAYPAATRNRADEYRPPDRFLEVTPETRLVELSEHLTLGQFLTKDQFEVWPKYVALDLRLIDKLELVIQELRAMGIRADRMHVMSGYRTPQYNGPGGDGRAELSRHMWGDAADVWIDNDGAGQMSDLNGDGLIDMDDAAVIMRAVERVEAKHPDLVGGAGTYPTTPTHGPYIHIDARGYRARW